MLTRRLLGSCVLPFVLQLGACTIRTPNPVNSKRAPSVPTGATGAMAASALVRSAEAGVPGAAPVATTQLAVPDRLPPVQRLLSDQSLVVLDVPAPLGERAIAVYDRQSSAKIATYSDVGTYRVLDEEHILLTKLDPEGNERWALRSPRLGTSEAGVTLTRTPGTSSLSELLGVYGDEIIYIEHLVADDSDGFSLKLRTRSLRDLAPRRTLDLARWLKAGGYPLRAELWKSGYVTLRSDDGTLRAHPLFVVELRSMTVQRLGVSVGSESVYQVGPGDTLAVMVKPGGPVHLFELSGRIRSRTIGFAGAAKEGGLHGPAAPCMSFDASGKRVVVSGVMGKTAWFDLRSNALIHQDEGDDFGGDTIDGCEVGFTPSERHVFEADRHGELRVFEASTGKLAFAHHLGERFSKRSEGGEVHWATSARVCPGHRCLVVRWNTGKTVLVDLESGQTQPVRNP